MRTGALKKVMDFIREKPAEVSLSAQEILDLAETMRKAGKKVILIGEHRGGSEVWVAQWKIGKHGFSDYTSSDIGNAIRGAANNAREYVEKKAGKEESPQEKMIAGTQDPRQLPFPEAAFLSPKTAL